MSEFQNSYREPWLLKLRLPEKQEPKLLLLKENTKPVELSDMLLRSLWTVPQLYRSLIFPLVNSREFS